MIRTKTTKGFTLIEMSIVLVIIGLIVGGILLGQNLIRQSQLNSVVTDVQRYIQATQNFQQKYGALPGDFATATTYWGSTGVCPTVGTPPNTCNGDGNGQIGISGASTAAPAEYFLYWEHLMNGGFIQGYYTGSHGSAGTSDHVFAASSSNNSPASRVDGAGFGVTWAGTVTSGTAYYTNNSYGHVYLFGGYQSNNFPATNIITTSEAYNLDSKYDDGYPGTGNIQSWQKTASYVCTNSATAPAAYDMTKTGYQCSMIFVTGF